MTQPGWSARLVRVVASQVRAHRRARGLSTRTLAEATAKLGHEIPRSVLANLEGGRRETVTVPELFVLAAALEVPPTELLLPIGDAATVEILAGVEVSILDALNWITGREPLPGTRWDASASGLLELHGFLLDQLQGRVETDRKAPELGKNLEFVRTLMRDKGMTPPGLPADLDLDGEP